MRRILCTIALALAAISAAHAQVKITALPSGTPVPTDILPFVAGPGGGTPVTKKATVADLLGAQHATCATNQFANAVSVAGVLQCAQPSFSNLSGSITTAQQPSTTVNAVANDTNIQGSISTQTLTFSWVGTLGKARQHSATVYNDQANTWSTGAQDMGGATSFKAPSSAGYSVSTSGTIGYDTTANRFSGGVNGVNKLFVHPDSIDTLTNKTISGASNTLSNIGNSSLTNSSITIAGHSVSLGGSQTLSNSDVGLGNVTNDTQTKASIVPNTAPSAGQLHVGNAGGTAFGVVSVSGDASLSSAGAISVTKINGTTPGGTCANQFVRTLSSSAVPTCATVANTDLASSSVTVGSTSISLGGTSTSIAGLSGGVNFGGTTLSNYDEGTWTPTLKFGGATTGITYTVQIGKYTRIGNRVFLSGRIVLSSKGSATGAATITGLPVAASSTTNFFQENFVEISGTYSGYTFTYIDPSVTTTISLANNNGGTGANLTDANFTNTSTITFTISYTTN